MCGAGICGRAARCMMFDSSGVVGSGNSGRLTSEDSAMELSHLQVSNVSGHARAGLHFRGKFKWHSPQQGWSVSTGPKMNVTP